MTRRAKVITAAAVAAIALLLSGAVWLSRDTKSTDQPVTAPHPPAPAISQCGLVGSRGMPTSLPARWENEAGWFLPISATDGPGRRSPGAWSCFAHTPAGAVLAGYIIPLRVDGLAEDRKSAITQQTVPGPAQTAKLASTPPQASEKVTVKGFSIAAYSDTQATIAYYVHTPTLEASCTADVQWYDHDWRLKLQDNGDTLSGCSQGVPASFVPWGPA